MRKKSTNGRKSRNWEETYDLPRELDFRKLRFVGVGMDAVRAHAARKRRSVELDPDVARVFTDSESVNKALRAVIAVLPGDQKRRKKTA